MVVKILGAVEKKSIIDDKRAAGCPKRYYRNGAIEIVYMHNTAKWITITHTTNKPLEYFINLYGLKELRQYFDFNRIVRYANVAGLKELTVSNNVEGTIWRVYLQAFTV